MNQPNPKPNPKPNPSSKPKAKGMHRSTKFLLASVASAATLSGWAWLTFTAAPQPVDAQQADPTDAAVVVPTQVPTDVPRVALVTTPVPYWPNLRQLPVRGLRYVGDAQPTVLIPRPTDVPPQAPPQVQAPPQPNNNQNQGNGGGGGGGQPQAKPQPKAPPPPPPPPPPKHKTKTSK